MCKKSILMLVLIVGVLGGVRISAGSYEVIEFPICLRSDGGEPVYPLVSGNYVVWQDARHSDDGIYAIYGYDLSTQTEFPIYTNDKRLEDLSFGGNIIAWRDYRNDTYDVYGYNLSTQTLIPIATGAGTQYVPDVSDDGSIVVWEGDYQTNPYSIYGYNVNNQTTFHAGANAVHLDDFKPNVSGDVVVWRDYRNGNYDIYGYDLNTQTEFPVCTNPSYQSGHRISGDYVVWTDDRNGNWDVYGYDLSTMEEFPIIVSNVDQSVWDVSGNMVVWNDGVTGIYGYDLLTKEQFAICTDGVAMRDVRISGNYVAWKDYRNEVWDIYGAEIIPEPCTLYLLTLGGVALLRKRRV